MTQPTPEQRLLWDIYVPRRGAILAIALWNLGDMHIPGASLAGHLVSNLGDTLQRRRLSRALRRRTYTSVMKSDREAARRARQDRLLSHWSLFRR